MGLGLRGIWESPQAAPLSNNLRNQDQLEPLIEHQETITKADWPVTAKER